MEELNDFMIDYVDEGEEGEEGEEEGEENGGREGEKLLAADQAQAPSQSSAPANTGDAPDAPSEVPACPACALPDASATDTARIGRPIDRALPSCCHQGGSWHGDCGSGKTHSWIAGVRACNVRACSRCGVTHLAGGKVRLRRLYTLSTPPRAPLAC